MRKQSVAQLVGVDKSYRIGGIEIRALEGITLSFVPGEFASLVGPAGSGWATLLSIIGCLSRPSSGRVVVAGTDVTRAGETQLDELRLKKIGFLSQAFNLIPNMTAFENIELALRMSGSVEGSIDGKVVEMLSSVGLDGKGTSVPRRLSRFEVIRLAIAKSLVNDPVLLVCDDPTANLEEDEADQIMELLGKFNQERGTAVILGTGSPKIAARTKRVIGMADGRTVPAGPLGDE